MGVLTDAKIHLQANTKESSLMKLTIRANKVLKGVWIGGGGFPSHNTPIWFLIFDDHLI